MLIKTASDNRDNSAEAGIGVRLSGINEVDFCVAELIEGSVEGDDIFVELELADDVVAGREDEGVGFVVITTEELIVAVATIKEITSSIPLECVVAVAAIKRVVA